MRSAVAGRAIIGRRQIAGRHWRGLLVDMRPCLRVLPAGFFPLGRLLGGRAGQARLQQGAQAKPQHAEHEECNAGSHQASPPVDLSGQADRSDQQAA